MSNPAEAVRASAIATFEPRERALSPAEIRPFLRALDHVATMPTLRLALRLILLTGVRKSEFIDAAWSEIDFDSERRTIPGSRMKSGKDHVVPLGGEALDVLTTFRSCFRSSVYVHPSGYDSETPISNADMGSHRSVDTMLPRLLPRFKMPSPRAYFKTGRQRKISSTNVSDTELSCEAFLCGCFAHGQEVGGGLQESRRSAPASATAKRYKLENQIGASLPRQ